MSNKPWLYRYKGNNWGDRYVCQYAPELNPQEMAEQGKDIQRVEGKCDIYSYGRKYYTPDDVETPRKNNRSAGNKNVCPNSRSAQSQFTNIPQERMDFGFPTFFN